MDSEPVGRRHHKGRLRDRIGGVVTVVSHSTNSDVESASSRDRSVRASFELFLISFLILFLELACIRWFGSTVIFLTFFTNIVLMACVLGMTVGCLSASRRLDFLDFL